MIRDGCAFRRFLGKRIADLGIGGTTLAKLIEGITDR
jgi:hypothetical protein